MFLLISIKKFLFFLLLFPLVCFSYSSYVWYIFTLHLYKCNVKIYKHKTYIYSTKILPYIIFCDYFTYKKYFILLICTKLIYASKIYILKPSSDLFQRNVSIVPIFIKQYCICIIKRITPKNKKKKKQIYTLSKNLSVTMTKFRPS